VTVSRTVVPGEWYGVLGERVIVLLPPEAKARVAGLWETVDEGAGFDEVLDAVISRGLRGLPAFVLLSSEGRDVRVVIRGAGEAELDTPDGPVTIAGSADTTWVEQNVTGVSGLRVRVADGDGPSYDVGEGLVRVAGVEHPARSATSAAPAAEPPTVAVPIEQPARILPPDPQLEAEKATAAAAEAAAMSAQPPVAPDLPPGPMGAVPPVPDALGLPGFDPIPEPPSTSTPATPPVARLLFSSGEVVDVDGPVVVGRAPEHGRFAGDGQTRLVTVPSPYQEISSTHLEIRPGTGADHGAAVVTDLGSTNGTVVVQPGLPPEDLRPGIAMALVPGATIDLGEGVTIQVSRV
jgi:hypothetical protein